MVVVAPSGWTINHPCWPSRKDIRIVKPYFGGHGAGLADGEGVGPETVPISCRKVITCLHGAGDLKGSPPEFTAMGRARSQVFPPFEVAYKTTWS